MRTFSFFLFFAPLSLFALQSAQGAFVIKSPIDGSSLLEVGDGVLHARCGEDALVDLCALHAPSTSTSSLRNDTAVTVPSTTLEIFADGVVVAKLDHSFLAACGDIDFCANPQVSSLSADAVLQEQSSDSLFAIVGPTSETPALAISSDGMFYACHGRSLCKGECAVSTGKPVNCSCTLTSECADTCLGGKCHVSGGVCDAGEDEDCASGQVCVDYLDPSSTLLGLCTQPARGSSCDDSSDCEGSDECTGHVCVASCSASNGRPNGCDCDGNNHCENTCIDGQCEDVSGNGGPCDNYHDCLTTGSYSYDCIGGVCEVPCTAPSGRPNGCECDGNNHCANTCIDGQCTDISGLGGPCDNYFDCSTSGTYSYDCVGGSCEFDCSGSSGRPNGCDCDGNNHCMNTCISGQCTDASGEGGPCDNYFDCLTTGLFSYDCVEGVCEFDCSASSGRPNGCDCDGNNHCYNTCIAGQCANLSGNGGPCDNIYDCLEDGTETYGCSGGICLLGCNSESARPNGCECDGNNHCENTCIDGECSDLSPIGGTCDTTSDCYSTTEYECVGDTCVCIASSGRPNGCNCDANSECENTCISGTCANLSGSDGPCESDSDCVGHYFCVAAGGNTCQGGSLYDFCDSNSDCNSNYCSSQNICRNAGGGTTSCRAGDGRRC